MDSFLQIFPEPIRSWIPYAAIYLILFAVIFNTLLDSGMFNRRTTIIVALCVSLLGLYGLDLFFLRALLGIYGSLTAIILIILAALILLLWVVAIIKRHNREN